MSEIGVKVPPLVDEFLAWLKAHGLEQDGPAFFRYNLVDMHALMEIDVGAAVKQAAGGVLA